MTWLTNWMPCWTDSPPPPDTNSIEEPMHKFTHTEILKFHTFHSHFFMRWTMHMHTDIYTKRHTDDLTHFHDTQILTMRLKPLIIPHFGKPGSRCVCVCVASGARCWTLRLL